MSIRESIESLSNRIESWAVSKGWLDKSNPRDPLILASLIHTEVSEFVEAYRHGNLPCEKPGLEHISAAEEELADIIVRVLQAGKELGLNVPSALMDKLDYNDCRSHRHGGKVY